MVRGYIKQFLLLTVKLQPIYPEAKCKQASNEIIIHAIRHKANEHICI